MNHKLLISAALLYKLRCKMLVTVQISGF